MRLYSYRGVSYTVAPSNLLPNSNPIHYSSVEHPTEQPIQQDMLAHRPPMQTPAAVIPMVYRGVLYLLERFHTSRPSTDEELLDTFPDESIESAKSADE